MDTTSAVPIGRTNYFIERPKVENVVEFTASSIGVSSKNPIITLTFLGQGSAWAPSYVVDISKKEKALFSSKSIIVNDLIPLQDTRVELIAGFPHIQFDSVNSAFSLQPVQQILERIRSLGRGSERFNVGSQISQQMMISNTAEAFTPSMPVEPVMGESAEDLYFYPVNNVTLKKGERGYYPLFAGEIPYEHLYTWEIPNYIDPNNSYQQNQPQAPQVVWHSLRLTNTTGQPWTTAPAMTVKDGHILGQDTIKYTPPNASSELKITHAISIKGEQNEYETERRRNAAQFYHSNYDLVTIKGELELTNYKTEDVTVEITKTLIGEIQETTGDPEIVKLASGLRMVNPTSQLVWTVDVKPGKDNQIKLIYTYQVYVRG